MADNLGHRFISCSTALTIVSVLGWLGSQPVVAQQVPFTVTSSRSASDAIRITIDADAASLRAVLDGIARRAGLNAIYTAGAVPVGMHVTVHVQHVPVAVAFQQALRGTNLVAQIQPDGYVTITREDSVASVTGTIAGRITDAKTGQPLHGVAIGLDGVERAAETAEDGTYRITGVRAGMHTITVKRIGYTRMVRTVSVAEGATASLPIALEASALALNQVVVTGTVIQTELKAVPNAMTVITAKEIERRGIIHIEQLFRGDVPGLFALNLGNQSPLDSVVMFSRGSSSLDGANASTPIKTYVDGVELANAAFLSQIDPRSIERIEILTGPQASTIYGSGAINGVMQIFTKRGTTTRPRLTATLLSGTLQSNYSHPVPQHDYSAQLNGIEGRWSYNTGGSWNYIGHWSPAIQQTITNGFGGGRLVFGPITGDASLRLSMVYNQQVGSDGGGISYAGNGLYTVPSVLGLVRPTQATLNGQTSGLTLGYAPIPWWSQELVYGADASDTETRTIRPGRQFSTDSLLFLSQAMNHRTSVRYAMTTRVPVASQSQLTVTAGADGWHNLTSLLSASASSLTGTLATTSTTIKRQSGHNTGAFIQSQFGIADAFFITYGLRAEWNPTYGSEAQPNYAPRYGAAYTRELRTPWGPLTAKLRGSYGRSTRPPTAGQKSAQTNLGTFGPTHPSITYYGVFDFYLANPALGPEFQQGGEGGLELYFGTRGSIVVTRYNQTTEHLIYQIGPVDSVRSLQPNPVINFGNYRTLDAAGYGYYPQYETVNIGSIRNQGWEAQGTLNLGALTTKGTYTLSKSRVLGYDPGYKAILQGINASVYAPVFQVGKSFSSFPEHTWALGATYGLGATSVSLTATGTGQRVVDQGLRYYQTAYSSIRLDADKVTMSPSRYPTLPRPGYAIFDLNASHQMGKAIDAVLQVQNVMNHYDDEVSILSPTLGRQTKLGFRWR